MFDAEKSKLNMLCGSLHRSFRWILVASASVVSLLQAALPETDASTAKALGWSEEQLDAVATEVSDGSID